MTLSHQVLRYNYIYPLGNEVLLKNHLSQCWARNKSYGRYTSYVGASLRLNKGDKVYVTVSNTEYITQEPALSYFGMFKL